MKPLQQRGVLIKINTVTISILKPVAISLFSLQITQDAQPSPGHATRTRRDAITDIESEEDWKEKVNNCNYP